MSPLAGDIPDAAGDIPERPGISPTRPGDVPGGRGYPRRGVGDILLAGISPSFFWERSLPAGDIPGRSGAVPGYWQP